MQFFPGERVRLRQSSRVPRYLDNKWATVVEQKPSGYVVVKPDITDTPRTLPQRDLITDRLQEGDLVELKKDPGHWFPVERIGKYGFVEIRTPYSLAPKGVDPQDIANVRKG